MLMENGLSIVTVKKSDLLKHLIDNRIAHGQIFKEAHQGYLQAVVEEMENNLKLAKERKIYRKSINLDEPFDHTKEYDRVIKMLQMSIKDEITISENEFRQFVLDDWAWKQQFATVSSVYRKNA